MFFNTMSFLSLPFELLTLLNIWLTPRVKELESK